MAKRKPTGTVTSPYSDKSWDVTMAKDSVAANGPAKGNRWVQIESLTPILTYAENLIDWFIEDVLGEAIYFPITVNAREMGAKSKSKHGHFELEPNWSTREGNPVWAVVLVAENLARDPREVVTTILHEAMHVYNFSRGEKDAAKSGRHNKVFAESAEGAGLLVEKVDKYGYVTTGIGDELWKKIETHMPVDVQDFNLFRNAFVPKERKPSKTKVYECSCGDFKLRVPAGKELDATCNLCEGAFELQVVA